MVTHAMTRHLVGTPGYIDPLYSDSGKMDRATDGYALGVTLLVCLTGHAAIEAKELAAEAAEAAALSTAQLHSQQVHPMQQLHPPDESLADPSAGEWPPDVVAELLGLYQGLACRSRSKRLPLSTTLERLEVLLRRSTVAAEPASQSAQAPVVETDQPEEVPVARAQTATPEAAAASSATATEPSTAELPAAEPEVEGPRMVEGFHIPPDASIAGPAEPLMQPANSLAAPSSPPRRPGVHRSDPSALAGGVEACPGLQGAGVPHRPGRPLRTNSSPVIWPEQLGPSLRPYRHMSASNSARRYGRRLGLGVVDGYI